MAAIKQDQRRPRRAPPDERPLCLINLLWGLTGDRERAYIFIEIIACIVLILCTPAYLVVDMAALAEKGTHGLAFGTLLPGGFFGGGWLIYIVIRIKRRLMKRRCDADESGC